MQSKQTSLFIIHHCHRYSYGGVLRNRRAGRGARPLACREALHIVFKIDRSRLRLSSLRSPQNFRMVHQVLRQYSRRFFVKIEQLSVQGDHIHALIRTHRRSHFHYFFRVVSGQIAQRFQMEGLLLASPQKSVTDTPPATGSKSGKWGDKKKNPAGSPRKGTRLWKHRPFSRLIKGWKAYQIVRNYIQLNEQEARGHIKYQKQRLKGLSIADWGILWS